VPEESVAASIFTVALSPEMQHKVKLDNSKHQLLTVVVFTQLHKD